MKKQIILSVVFSAAAFTAPALAHDGRARDYGSYKLPGVNMDGPLSAPLYKAPETNTCDLRDSLKKDLGGGWSVGMGGSLSRPKVSLNWRMSLQPELEKNAPQKNCVPLDLRR